MVLVIIYLDVVRIVLLGMHKVPMQHRQLRLPHFWLLGMVKSMYLKMISFLVSQIRLLIRTKKDITLILRELVVTHIY